jgi:hypothetical protein
VTGEEDFFKIPEVETLINEAGIEEMDLQTRLHFREQVMAEIKGYLQRMEELDQIVDLKGFKAYSLGRDEWKED